MPPSMAPKANAASVAIGVARRNTMTVPRSWSGMRNWSGIRTQQCREHRQKHDAGSDRKREHGLVAQ